MSDIQSFKSPLNRPPATFDEIRKRVLLILNSVAELQRSVRLFVVLDDHTKLSGRVSGIGSAVVTSNGSQPDRVTAAIQIDDEASRFTHEVLIERVISVWYEDW